MDIKTIIAPGKVAKFKQYRQNTLYYETDDGFIVGIPISDLGTTTLNAEEPAAKFTKWIQKTLD